MDVNGWRGRHTGRGSGPRWDHVPPAGIAAVLLLPVIRVVTPTTALWLILGTLLLVVGGTALLSSGRRRGR